MNHCPVLEESSALCAIRFQSDLAANLSSNYFSVCVCVQKQMFGVHLHSDLAVRCAFLSLDLELLIDTVSLSLC